MNEIAQVIGREIVAAGPISFACFMEMALYHPELGYYERAGPQTGRRGDFYTSVNVGSLFGELLAFQIAEWLGQVASDSSVSATEPPMTEGPDLKPQLPETAGTRFQIVEAGAHDGCLALDILDWCRRHRPELVEKLEYLIIEPSPGRRHRQEAALHAWGPGVKWCESWESVPPQSVRGVIFANELLDAFPVHRVGWDARQEVWFEWGVGVVADRFEWIRLANNSSKNDEASRMVPWPNLPGELLAVLPDQFTTEICPAAEQWWRRAAVALRTGRLLTLDYGLKAEEFFVPQRAGGTLRNYQRHRQDLPLLADPGEQDLTADVNFSALQIAGEAAGLNTAGFSSQAEFLTRIAEKAWKLPESFDPWTPARIRQFQTLTHPEHLGRSFRVLIQSR